MAIAWIAAIVLNRYEHDYEIRSSTGIQSYNFFVLVGSAIAVRTLSALPSTPASQHTLFYIYFGLACLSFIVESWPRGWTRVQRESGMNAYEKANIFSRYWFHYLLGTIRLGYKRPLQPEDIREMMPQRIKTRFSYKLLSKKWDQHVNRCNTKGTEPNLMLLTLGAYGTQWVPVLIYRTLASVLLFIAPELMSQLLAFTASYSNDVGAPVSLGILLSIGMFLTTLASALMEGQFNQLIMNMGIEARTALISMIYRKALKLSPSARQSETPGEICNHMSVDAERWSDALTLLPLWFSIPLEICIALWLLYNQIGWSALASLGTIIAVSPFQAWIAAFFTRAKDEKLEAMDNRIRLVNEVMAGIKIVKLYGWESSFMKRISRYREREMAILKKIGIAFSFMTITFSSLTLLMALFSFSIYATVGGPGGTQGVIDAQTIFVSITLFGLLNRPIGMLSHITGETMGLIVATKRIQRYLLAEELADSVEWVESPTTTNHDTSDLNNATAPVVVDITNGVFAWEKEGPQTETDKQRKYRENKEARRRRQEAKEAKSQGLPPPSPEPFELMDKKYEPTLKDIQLKVKKGNLAAIVGRVGQGKSSLFNAMIGDMYKRQGTVRIAGKVAYAPQQAWIINATLKDNILFDKAFDQERYDRIVFASGLEPDLKMLPAGDQTEI
ncbi:Multidrug resistance-associated protein 1, partial [Lunasporangiospora selenospora]